MPFFRLAVLALVGAIGVGCVQPLQASPLDRPAPAPEVVEERWPDGQLRLRKQVVRQEDGTLVDHGKFERWYDNGAREYEAVFSLGKKEGTTLRYHRNGVMAARQEYRNGKRHGTSVNWNESGVKVKEESWADGRPHGTWTIWQDGKIKWTHEYVHGDPDP